MEELAITPPTATEIQQYHEWWNQLSGPWKVAFNEVFMGRKSEDTIPDETIHGIWSSPALRFAGPTAMYPNMTIELDDLTGIAAMPNVKILVVAHHNVRALAPIAHWNHLESLFVFNNQLTRIDEVAGMTNLKEIYFQSNQVASLKPLENLTNLHTIYCNHNRLEKLEGIGEQHADNLKQFVCLPNELIRDRDVMLFEREVGIRCLKG